MRCSILVMPASSPVLAALRRTSVLMSVLLPTLGTPQISTRSGLTMPPRSGASALLARGALTAVIRRVMEVTLSVLREHRQTVLSVLEPFLSDPTVDEVMVNSLNPIYIERDGKILMVKDCPLHGHFEDVMAIDTEFFKHLPGIFTGLGIIGTFTGLISGLMNFDVSSPEHVQWALSQLVQTVGQAFLISAAAITLAMVFTWVEKAVLAARYRQVEDLQQSLDSLFAPKGGAEYMERLALATEMQVALSYKILGQLRTHAPTASSKIH